MSNIKKNAGFSLIEVMIVLLIISGATVLLTTSFLGNLKKRSVYSASAEIEHSLINARMLARRSYENVFWIYDVDTHTISFGSAYQFTLPVNVRLELTYADALPQPGIMFYSDGGSSGGQVQIEHEYGQDRYDVDWILGLVKKEDEVGEKGP
ncbi:MAG: type II secretion system protein [Henriciella sp.]|nr:type II secretion system protein [Henriciella sp.]